MFKKLARLVVGHPWWVIGAWVIGAILLLTLSPQLVHFTSNNNSSFLPSSYESVQAQQVEARYFPAASGASGTIVVSVAGGGALTTADQQKVAALAAALTADKIPAVTSVITSPLFLAPDKSVQLVQVVFTGQAGTAGPNAAVPIVRSDTTTFLSGTGLDSGLTGNAAISVDSTQAFDNAEKIIAIATVLLILVLLGIVFRSVLIAVLPIVVIGLVHQMAQALTADLADWFGFVVGPELAPLLVVVMFGVGTDYIVFLLFRHRERMAGGDNAEDSLRFSVERVGEVIASAGATVMAAFAALLVASLESLRTLAPGLIAGILLMLAAALTLVPAILSLLGKHVFWPTPPKLRQSSRRTRSELLAGMVAKHPAVVLTVWSAVLIGLAFGILGFKTTYNQLAELPQSTPSEVAYNTMASAFPAGYLGPTQVFVVSANSAPLDQADITDLATGLSKVDGVSKVLPPQYTTDKGQAVIDVLLTADPYSVTAMNTVIGPISRAAPQDAVPEATVYVGGTTAQLADVRTALRNDMEHVFPLALAIVAVILALLLRALIAPIYLLIGVVLTYVATLGVVSLIFLTGLNYSGLDFTIPIVVYLFVMAIGTDYNILISARLREGFDEGLPPREASRLAIVHGSPAVASAALILAGTFASLLLTGIQLLEEIGLAVALGVLLAANVLATRIVPTLAALRGWHFWWPHHRHRLTAPDSAALLGDDRPTPAETADAP
ncbi:MAG TPA: MMPL family transporter [Acidimicrobiales bacterium]|jgi:RND superfamily putative drug exporter|nr:MMPL family transporter [Acidimicrobiales bacterium]